MQWKISKLGTNKSLSLTNVLENKIEIVNRSHRDSRTHILDDIKVSVTPENIFVIEKRLKDLELSREVESSENFKKISKLEKIVEGIKKEKSISPKKMSNDIEVKGKRKIRVRSVSAKSVNNRNKSLVLKTKTKPKKLCVYIKDLEEEAEKWKRKAHVLAKKYYSDIKEMKRNIIDMKNKMDIERQDFREYCYSVLQGNK